MARPELSSRPLLAPGCRLNDASREPRVLLMPERALRLNGPSLEIITRCDGAHTVQQIVSELQSVYSKSDPQRVQEDILGYLAQLHDQHVLEFVPRALDCPEDAG